jgi:hypothetical protein
MNENQKAKCTEIAEHYGKRKQKMQAMQEMTELILLLTQRQDQKKDRGEYISNLIDEMSDTLIMIEQLRQLYMISEFEIRQRIDFKLNRQLERIQSEQEEN